LNELAFLFINFTISKHHFNNSILTPTNPQSRILGMLIISRHKILPHNNSKTCNLAFPPTYMLIQAVKLRNQ
jgi:hypothetical protein